VEKRGESRKMWRVNDARKVRRNWLCSCTCAEMQEIEEMTKKRSSEIFGSCNGIWKKRLEEILVNA